MNAWWRVKMNKCNTRVLNPHVHHIASSLASVRWMRIRIIKVQTFPLGNKRAVNGPLGSLRFLQFLPFGSAVSVFVTFFILILMSSSTWLMRPSVWTFMRLVSYVNVATFLTPTLEGFQCATVSQTFVSHRQWRTRDVHMFDPKMTTKQNLLSKILFDIQRHKK